MVRYLAPVFVHASGARTIGAVVGDLAVNGFVQEIKVPFIEAIIAPKTTKTAGKFGQPIPVPETMIVTCAAALDPVPGGWTVDPLFTDEVERDFRLRHDTVRGRKAVRPPRAQAGQ